MDNLEHTIHDHPLSQRFLYWFRYVDDIICCFTGSNRQLHSFLNFINAIHPKIKFTLEEEMENSINFLDLRIKKVDKKHSFSIYHKPSHTDTVIHNSSVHPIQQKMSSFNSMVHRLVNLPLSKVDFNKEKNIIMQIASNNKYRPELINSLINKKLYKRAVSEVYPLIKEKSIFNVLTYMGTPSLKLKSFLASYKLNISFRTTNNIGKIIKNNKSKINKNQMCGVYKINCGSCEKFYIGRTFRNFQIRLSEHKRSFEKKKTDSHYANHLIDENHKFSSEFEILYRENKGSKLNLLESLQINKFKNSGLLLNSQLDVNTSPLLNMFNKNVSRSD
ncbi:hypothetical protein WA026_006560 [Henosepilachna vigintioctopunctata]